MAINISGISNAATAALSLSNLVLVTPKETIGYQPKLPLNADGTVSTKQQPPTFLFDFEGAQSLDLQSDITDHFREDNSPIEDNIALRPETYTTRGFIGELNNIPPAALQIVREVASRLTTITAYAPQVSATAALAYARAFAAYQLAQNVKNTAVAAWSSISSAVGATSPLQTKQQKAFQQFYGYWRNKTLFTIQTPWGIFDNMAILKLRVEQDEDTNMVTSFDLTFKMIRTVSSRIIEQGFGSTALDGRAASQSSSLTDYGTGTLGPAESLDSGITSMLG